MRWDFVVVVLLLWGFTRTYGNVGSTFETQEVEPEVEPPKPQDA